MLRDYVKSYFQKYYAINDVYLETSIKRFYFVRLFL